MLNDNDLAKVLADLGAMHVMYGKPEPSAAVLNMLLDDIEGFGAQVISKAFKRLRTTFDGRAPITSALLVQACEAVSGRLSADEAWALALTARDEAVTVVWTDEIEQAWWGVQELVNAPRPDLVGARRAFIETYERVCAQARDAGRAPRVTCSLGQDKQLQRVALDAAVQRGLDVAQLAGTHAGEVLALAAPQNAPVALLGRDTKPAPLPDDVRAKLAQLRDKLAKVPELQAKAAQERLERERQAWESKKAEQAQLVGRYMVGVG